MSADALDHQLFIIVLGVRYLFRDWRTVLILVTAFTIGHSLTLALSVLDVFRFPAKWVEFLIPCTIFITALTNLLPQVQRQKSVRLNYIMALTFGWIHGMGFANTLRVIMARDQNLASGLLGFNLGLEAGQLVFVALLLMVSEVLVTRMHINRRDWIFFCSAGTFSLALKMALERIPF